MNIFKKATMICRRILEYDAVLATPACKAFEEVKKDYYKAW